VADFIPFDPKKHKPVDAVSLGLPNAKKGMDATEFLASEKSPEGGVWNIPTIWFNEKTGEPTYFKNIDRAWNEAKAYEEKTGKKFPRFKTLPLAVAAAEGRSKKGGATYKELVTGKPRLLFRKDE